MPPNFREVKSEELDNHFRHNILYFSIFSIGHSIKVEPQILFFPPKNVFICPVQPLEHTCTKNVSVKHMEKMVTSLKNKKETNLAFVINQVTQNKLKKLY